MQSIGMQGMSHLSRGLLAGLQNSHVPSLDTSVPFQLQLSSALPSPHSLQGVHMQSHGGHPQSGPFSFATRPPMVRSPPPAFAAHSCEFVPSMVVGFRACQPVQANFVAQASICVQVKIW